MPEKNRAFLTTCVASQTLTTEVWDGEVGEHGNRIVYFETRDENNAPVLTLGRAEFAA